VKLLFDENLSRKLPVRLAELYPGSRHVAEADLLQTADTAIWRYAGLNGFVIVTTDSDFFDFAANLGPPPKVIWLRRWDHPTRDAEALLRREAVRITQFANDFELGILVLDKPR
jgi:predicted nuclease of predicted toxin-antitoxin system